VIHVRFTEHISSRYIKKLIDDAPLGFGFYLSPCRCGDHRNAIEPNPVKAENPFVKK
jgi:hypothetical protein